MLVSTRGRYALRVMLDLAERYSEDYIPMKDVAGRQNLPLKYLEKIMPLITKGALVEGVHGKGGGYRLMKRPEDCLVGDILRLTEGDLAPVACLGCDAKPCERANDCRTLPMCSTFYRMVNDYFDGITLADLLASK